MSKRPITSAEEAPDAKRPAGFNARGRVVLDVGGTRFVSSRSTLEAASSYFESLLLRWNDEGERDSAIFIDAAFATASAVASVATIPVTGAVFRLNDSDCDVHDSRGQRNYQ